MKKTILQLENMNKLKIKYFLLLFAIIVAVGTKAQTQYGKEKIKWYSFEKAIELNKENPKKIFIDVYTDWCGWCKKMDNTTFSDPVIAEYMNKYYYAVKLDAETTDTLSFMGNEFYNIPSGRRRSTHQLAQALLQGKMSYPSYVFMNEKNQMLTVVGGYIKVVDFEPIINFFGSDAFLNKKWEEFKTEFVSKTK